MLALVSAFSAPAASFSAIVSGALITSLAVGRSRAAVLVALTPVAVGTSSLYFLGDALLARSAESLALGVALSVAALLALYLSIKLLALGGRLRGSNLVASLICLISVVYTSTRAGPLLARKLESLSWDPMETAALSGLLYIGATLPYSSPILFSLVYMVYSILRSSRSKEPP